MRRWKGSELQPLVGQRDWSPAKPAKAKLARKEGTLLVDGVVLQYALSHGKQKQLATYCRLRHASYLNAGLIFQDMLKNSTERVHLSWLRKMGWVRNLRWGVYQIVSMKTIASRLGTCRTAAALSPEDWKDPIAACYAGWLTCYAKGWKNRYPAAISDEVKRHHFVIASAGMVSRLLGVTEVTVRSWKERAWKYYWQKESVKRVLTEEQWSAGMLGGYRLGAYRQRGGFRVALGPNVYYDFQLTAVRRDRI